MPFSRCFMFLISRLFSANEFAAFHPFPLFVLPLSVTFSFNRAVFTISTYGVYFTHLVAAKKSKNNIHFSVPSLVPGKIP